MAKPRNYARKGSFYGFYDVMRDTGYSDDRGAKPGRGEAGRSGDLPKWKKPKKNTPERTDEKVLRRGRKGTKRRAKYETYVADEATEARLSTTIRHREFE